MFDEAFNKNDAVALAAFYTDDAVYTTTRRLKAERIPVGKLSNLNMRYSIASTNIAPIY